MFVERPRSAVLSSSPTANRVRKMSFRGHGCFVGGTTCDMPPPPTGRG